MSEFRIKSITKSHMIVAFLLLCAIPLIRTYFIPVFSFQRFLILIVLCLYFIPAIIRSMNSRITVNLSAVDLIFALYYLSYLTSYLLSSNSDVSFVALLDEFPFILLYIFFRKLFTREESGGVAVSAFLSITVVVLSIWGLLQYFFDIDLPGSLKALFKTHHFPVIASMGNPNFLAEFLILSFPFVLSFFYYSRSYIFFFITSALMVLTVFLTYSRLAWAVMLMFIIISVALSTGDMRKKLAVTFVMLILIAASFFIYHYQTGSTRPLRVVRSIFSSEANVLTEREVIYKTGIKMLGESLITGMGPGSFGYNYLIYQGRASAELDKESARYEFIDLDHAHSDFLEIGVDSGYLSMAIFILLILYSVYSGIKKIIGDERNDVSRYIHIVPLLYIPFGIWGFPFYLPFSKMVLLISFAYLSGKGYEFQLSIKSIRLISALLILLILAFTYFNSRYMMSIYLHKRGLSNFNRNYQTALDDFSKGIDYFPYNGYNYFSSGALLLNHSQYSGILYLMQSLKYLRNSQTYLYIARGYRDLGMIEKAKEWYEKVLFLRPDFSNARKEYKEILDPLDK